MKVHLWFSGFNQKNNFYSLSHSRRYIPANTIRSDRIGFPNNRWSPAKLAEENTNSKAWGNSLPVFSLWVLLIFHPGCKDRFLKCPLKLSYFWNLDVFVCYNVQHWPWTEGEGSSGGGHRPCLLSFRSAQSQISSLTEMLLSLCQIRPHHYTYVTPQHAVNWTDNWEMEAFLEGFPLRDTEHDQNLAESRLSFKLERRKALLQSSLLTFVESIVQACWDVAVFTV